MNQEVQVNAIKLLCRNGLAASWVYTPPFPQAANGPKTLKNKERASSFLPMSKFYITTQTTKHLFNLWLSPCKKTKYLFPHFPKRVFSIFFRCVSHQDFVCSHRASDLTETGKHSIPFNSLEFSLIGWLTGMYLLRHPHNLQLNTNAGSPPSPKDACD